MIRHSLILSPSSSAALVAVAIALAACTPSEFSARRIADRNTRARGGIDAWRAVQTMSMTGKMDVGVPHDPARQALAYQARNAAGPGKKPVGLPGARADKPVQLPFVMEVARPRKSRLEIQFQGQTAVQVYDGKRGWKLRPFLGRNEVEPYSNDELLSASQQDQLDGLLIGYAAKGSRLHLEATEKVEGREADKIKITLANGQVRNLWVDKESGLEVKLDGSRRLDGKSHAVWTFFRDYRKVDGLMIPHVLETVVDGVSGSEKIVIEKVVINPPLEEARFERPSPPAVHAAAVLPTEPTPPSGAAEPSPAPTDDQGNLKRATRTTATYKIPSVHLVREDGTTVSLPEEIDDGKPVVLTFIFTSCATICPVMSSLFSQLQDRLGADRSKVHMASISIDPERDRPERLAEYAKRYHAGPQWHYYTGTVEASLAVQRAFDTYRGDKMNHAPVTFVRARSGSSWLRIDGYPTPDELAGEVRSVLAVR
jgi:cytochrome oxidase Cu insertion factor (SCO1/SenC/PrrC family)